MLIPISRWSIFADDLPDYLPFFDMTTLRHRGKSFALAASFVLLPVVFQGAGCGPSDSEPTQPPGPEIITVTGRVSADEMGFTLAHEHVLVDFVGADQVDPARYDADSAFQVILPHLEEAARLGVHTLVEATPAYLGRDPLLLKRLSESTGLLLLTNTGYYGARDHIFLPPHAFVETADELAARWIAEFRNGIGDTGVRPGFIKIGMDRRSLSDTMRVVVRAAARTHLATGLTIAAHTGTSIPAREQLAMLTEEGVHPSAWIWVHAQNETDLNEHVLAAQAGAWISFDGLGPDNVEAYVERLVHMRDAGVLDRVLVSHDAGWYSVGEPGGGTYRGYGTLVAQLLPALQRAGFEQAEIERVTRRNPAEAFAVHVRATAES